jgi:membrane fusion protein, heavy metal efflux system
MRNQTQAQIQRRIQNPAAGQVKRGVGCCGLAAIVCAAMVLGGCGGEQKRAEQMTSYSANASQSEKPQLFTVPQDQMSHVKVVTVQPSSFVQTLRFSGAVAFNAFATTSVITQVGGPVSRILVVPGNYVKEGQPLLEVSSPDYSQIRAVYLKARDAARLADKNYARAQDLYAHQAIAERDLQQAESDKNQAHVDLESAEQSLRILGVPKPEGVEAASLTAEIPLLAPISGEVVERLVSPGQVIQAGATQAFTISDMRTVWVMANIYQDDLSVVKVGDDVTVQTDAFPDVFHGKISFIGAALDPNTRTMQARIVVDNKGDKLKKDMYVTVSVTAGTVKNALTVPDAAILRDEENQPFVYVLNGSNEFGRRGVDIGSSNNGQTQIRSGLKPGDQIVGDGSLFLQFANSLQR